MTGAAAGPDRSGGAPSALAIDVRDLVKRYGRTLALDGVSLGVAADELFALLGPNGAGKTTLLHILCTILAADSGTVLVAGHDARSQPRRVRQNIGVVFQDPSLDDRLTVAENLEFHGLVYGVPRRLRRQRIAEMLALVELTEARDAVVRGLSGGMKRRLEIARALVHGARLLFLDEPTTGLDVQSRDRIWSYVHRLRRELGVTVVVSTHYLAEVESCDRVCIMDHGKVVALGAPDALRARHGTARVRLVARGPEAAARICAAHEDNAVLRSGGEILIPATAGGAIEPLLAAHGDDIREISLERPSLESVFLALTGRDLREDNGAREAARGAARRAGQR